MVWTGECEEVFKNLKTHLCSSSVLQSLDFPKRFLVQVDTSTAGLGAVLAQEEPGNEHPILYLSQKLLRHMVLHSGDGLAIKWALESLRYYLLRRAFDLKTDHRALTWINSMKYHNS